VIQGIEIASLKPSSDMITRLNATMGPVCPLICGKGTAAKNGRREKLKQEAKIELKPEPRIVERKKNEVLDTPSTRKTSKAGSVKCYICNNRYGGTSRKMWMSEVEFAQRMAATGQCRPL
jgi:hypothetical protein